MLRGACAPRSHSTRCPSPASICSTVARAASMMFLPSPNLNSAGTFPVFCRKLTSSFAASILPLACPQESPVVVLEKDCPPTESATPEDRARQRLPVSKGSRNCWSPVRAKPRPPVSTSSRCLRVSSSVVDTSCVWATQSASSAACCALCHESRPSRPVSSRATAKPHLPSAAATFQILVAQLDPSTGPIPLCRCLMPSPLFLAPHRRAR